MEKNEILNTLQNIFRDVFDNEDIEITVDTVAEDIEEWDSLSHIQLIKEMEKMFGIKLTAREIMSWDNVGEIINSIHSKL
ncbi:acyl carrier protein [Bacteroides sp. AM10-21B]|uniref:acyl carrier protein n=1 Tax=Bacteroides sp. AM10-21B TaxID=2292001 RepID=UPI000E4B9134|nr:acyl carrier protein [Bacteroides sp. AM10-21B]RHJ47595.1 acyl carrier protein [Bacteroides sp. AM10-21B]